MNRVVTVEQVPNGYMVVITPIKDESFFENFDEVVLYLTFYFNVKNAEA